jgi:REP element-mobilizing transposase RayT
MEHNPAEHYRRSIRLRGYDYKQSGAYFVTVVTHHRECLFGKVVDGEMRLNKAGCMVQAVWQQLPAHYPGVECDAFVVMPNHIHGIIVLVGAGPRACPGKGQPQGVAPTLSLPDVVHRLKTVTTKRYADSMKKSGGSLFLGRLWQRNYFEHVIRNEPSLNHIRQYILDNPARWAADRENPAVVTPEPKDAWRG